MDKLDYDESGLPILEKEASEKDVETIQILEKNLPELPDNPTAGQLRKHSAVEREINMAKVEVMWQQGSNINQISRATGLSRHHTISYIEAVKARWALEGSKRNVQETKGAGLSRLKSIERELWNIVHGRNIINKKGKKGKRGRPKLNLVNDEVRIKALAKLLDCHDKRLYLEGASAEMLQELPSSFDNNSGSKSMAERKLEAERYQQLVDKFRDFIKDKAIDITPKDKDNK